VTATNFNHICPYCGHVSTGRGHVLYTLGEEVQVERFAAGARGMAGRRIHSTGWRGPDGHQCGDGFMDDDMTRALGPCPDA
jgi:hypothetical protein